jgi:fructokinase
MSGQESNAKTVVGLGELLWDLLPEGPRLGGAPANFAVMAGRLGDAAVIASRLGADALGAEARSVLGELPLDSSQLQTDAELSTGTVTVALSNGEPQYTIHEPVAWDRMEFTPAWAELAQRADAVCFGTLAQRDRIARRTILSFLEATRSSCVRVFDANLRAPFWSAEVLRVSLARATILKLNAGELPLVLQFAGVCPHPPTGRDHSEMLLGAHRLLERYPLQMVCVTLGAEGSLLVTRDDLHVHRGRAAQVRDTVGAGDAFTAALTHYYLEGASLPVLNEAGNRWGSWMASQTGAMPPLEAETLERMAREVEARV